MRPGIGKGNWIATVKDTNSSYKINKYCCC